MNALLRHEQRGPEPAEHPVNVVSWDNVTFYCGQRINMNGLSITSVFSMFAFRHTFPFQTL